MSASDLVMRFGKVEALRGIDLDIRRGELFALIGPDGAGKTTFFRIVAKLLRPTSGTVEQLDVRTFGLVPQRFALYEDLSIDENLNLRAQLYEIPLTVARKRAPGPARARRSRSLRQRAWPVRSPAA